MRSKLIISAIVFVIFFETAASLNITGVKCRSKICQPKEYCSQFDNTCQPCDHVCNTSNHNFDETVCVRDCQDYIHDSRYVSKGENSQTDNEELREMVDSLQRIVTVTLSLTSITLIILFAIIAVQICRWKEKNQITVAKIRSYFSGNQKSDNPPKSNGHKLNPANKNDLTLEMPGSVTVQSEHSPATVTTGISRRPAEDSALDYAYDNPAMSSPGSKPRESNF